MAKLESSFKNMVISLVSIAVIAAAALAGVYTLTKDKIEEQKAEKKQQAILEVLPNKGAGAIIAPVDTLDAEKKIYAYRAYADSTFADSVLIGVAVETNEIGFGGKFKLMVGFDKENRIVNYTVLEHQETPGLGDKMGKWFNDPAQPKRCVIGREAGALEVSKDGGEVDAITAATISSRAFLKAVNGAYNALYNSPEEELQVEEHHCQGHCQHGEGHQCGGQCKENQAEEHHCCGHCQHGEGHQCQRHCQHHQEANIENVKEEDHE